MQNNNPPAVPAPVSGIYDKRVREQQEYQREWNRREIEAKRAREQEQHDDDCRFLAWGWQRPSFLLLNGVWV